MGKIAFALAGAIGIVVAVFGVTAPQANHTTLDRKAEPFKSRFNADSGTTRIVMLVAPT